MIFRMRNILFGPRLDAGCQSNLDGSVALGTGQLNSYRLFHYPFYQRSHHRVHVVQPAVYHLYLLFDLLHTTNLIFIYRRDKKQNERGNNFLLFPLPG